MGATTREQTSFRLRDDDGSESAATFRQAINIDDTLTVDTNFRVRFGITHAGMIGDVTGQLQYNLASAGWNNVDASSSVVQSVASPNVADNATITEQLNQGNTFVGNTTPTGLFDEVDGLVSSQTIDVTEETEMEFCFTIISGDVTDLQTLQLRVSHNGAALTTYTQTPTITVSEPAGAKATGIIFSVLGPGVYPRPPYGSFAGKVAAGATVNRLLLINPPGLDGGFGAGPL